MEVIYTGKEKNLHLKLVERMMSEKHIDAKDVAYIRFTNTQPNDKFPLWIVNIDEYINNCTEYITEDEYNLLKEVLK